MELSIFLSVCLGLGLAAACGFRVFVPLLVMSLAARGGYLELVGSFEWIAATPALVMFAVATVLEIGAYYVPWLDNLLDGVATPAAAVAGVIVTASVVTGMDPLLKWPLAVIAGGGIAGAVQATTVAARAGSVLGTGGMANPLVSSAEAGASFGLTVLALVLPLAAAAAVVVLFLVLRRALRRRRAVG
ncbi:MAG: DUF4126 domain-containing protein [Acidobacteriota bacterium]|nr:DUF4126 domain-containing protein [Acidobacteriota bacterium]MDH3522980.1 DUF4126 domain-containing protein [Acidobacteriota bacterium]